MHLEDEQIQRVLHGELAAPAKQAVERHLAECASCMRRFEEAQDEERWILGLLREADHAAPAVDAEALAARAGRTDRGGDRRWSWGRGFAGDLRLRWAAGIVLVLAATGIAYTAPGSPVPEWIDRVIEGIAGRTPGGPSGEPATVSPRAPATAGIAVAPNEHFTIRFAAPQSEGVAAVSLTDGPEIVARATTGGVTFATEADRLTIGNAGATADYEIELPRAAAWVEILVGERRLLLKEADRVATDAAADDRGRYLLPLAPPGH